jgi:hypothetical protein
VNITYLLPSFPHLLNRFIDGKEGTHPSLSGVQYAILKNLAQKTDFDLKIETIRENAGNTAILHTSVEASAVLITYHSSI